MATPDKPITQSDLDQLAAEIEEDRKVLEQIGLKFGFLHDDVLQLSQALDNKIATYTHIYNKSRLPKRQTTPGRRETLDGLHASPSYPKKRESATP